MSLLKKLFGSKSEEVAAKLETQARGRSSPRVQLVALHRIVFQGSDGKEMRIHNVSLTGIGFARDSADEWPPAGTELEGDLRVEDKKIPMKVKLIHLTGKVAGCAFVGEFGAVQRLVLDYFRIELAALNMIAAPAEMLQEDPDGQPFWFHGKNNCELFYVLKQGAQPGELVRFQLSFFANYVEGGGADGRTRFGTVVEDNAFDKPRHKESMLVKWHDAPSPDQIEAIVTFLKNVPGLPLVTRDELARQIRWVRAK